MENNENDFLTPSVSMIVEGSRRGPISADLDLVQEYRLAREVPIDENMALHTEMARLDIVEALRSATMTSGSRMFPQGSGILVPTAHDAYLIDESYNLQVIVRQPTTIDGYERLYRAAEEAHREAERRHREL